MSLKHNSRAVITAAGLLRLTRLACGRYLRALLATRLLAVESGHVITVGIPFSSPLIVLTAKGHRT